MFGWRKKEEDYMACQPVRGGGQQYIKIARYNKVSIGNCSTPGYHTQPYPTSITDSTHAY